MFASSLEDFSEDNHRFTKVQQKSQKIFVLVLFLQALVFPSPSSKILNVFKSYLQFITRKDGLKEGQKVYEIVLDWVQLNSFPPEGMDCFFGTLE